MALTRMIKTTIIKTVKPLSSNAMLLINIISNFKSEQLNCTREEKKINKGNVFENIKHFFPNARKERHIQTNGANSTYNSQTKETKYGTYESI